MSDRRDERVGVRWLRRHDHCRPRAQPGYYPGFTTLAQQAFWDEATRAMVLAPCRERAADPLLRCRRGAR